VKYPKLTPLETEEEFCTTESFLIERYGEERTRQHSNRTRLVRGASLVRVNKALEVKGQLSKPSYVSPLKMIVDPDNDLLRRSPPFYRFMYHLIAEKGREEAALTLDIHRMSLWEMLSGKYQFNQEIISSLGASVSGQEEA
jgi:hypothetical protein